MRYIEVSFETNEEPLPFEERLPAEERIVALALKLPLDRIVKVSAIENGKYRDFAATDALDQLCAMHGWSMYPVQRMHVSDDTAGSLTVYLGCGDERDAISQIVALCQMYASEILSDQVGIALLTEEEAPKYVV